MFLSHNVQHIWQETDSSKTGLVISILPCTAFICLLCSWSSTYKPPDPCNWSCSSRQAGLTHVAASRSVMVWLFYKAQVKPLKSLVLW